MKLKTFYLFLLIFFTLQSKTIFSYHFPSLDEVLSEESNDERIINNYIKETKKNLTAKTKTIKVYKQLQQEDLQDQNNKKDLENITIYNQNSESSNWPFIRFNSIKHVNHDLVRFFIKYYSTVGKAFLNNSLKRMKVYFPVVKKFLKKHNLPLEFSVLPIVESGYNPIALSHKGARGMWQLMPLTGRIYSLNISNAIDERMDILKSTESAILYIKSLSEMFNKNWDLVIAGYNGGGGYISSMIRKHKKTSFWKLCKISGFKSETLEFVPRFYAILHILKNPDIYGIENNSVFSNISFEHISIKYPVPFSKISSITSIPMQVLKDLNPHLLKKHAVDGARLYVPRKMGTMTLSKINTNINYKKYILAKKAEKSKKTNVKLKMIRYRIRRGDTIYKVSKRFSVSVKNIVKFNRLKRKKYLYKGLILKIPIYTSKRIKRKSIVRNVKHYKKSVYKNKRKNLKIKRRNIVKHIVRKGETLYRIAKRYQVSAKKIININRILNPKRIFKGMVLRIPLKKKKGNKSFVYYKVRKGDTLYKISKKFKVSVIKIINFNQISNKKYIVAGIILKIPSFS